MDDRRPLNIGMLVTYDLCERGGGVKQHATQLADALRARGDRVTLIGPASRSIENANTRGFSGVMEFWSNGSANRLGILVSPLALWRYLRRHSFDVLHIHEPLPPVVSYYTAWMCASIPKVATFHAYSEQSSKPLLMARRVFAPLILPFIQRGIAVSEPALRHARIDWRGPLEVIPNGVSTDVFRPGRYEHGLRTVRLLFVGRISDPRKGFEYALDATARARALGVGLELHVVGEISPREKEHLPPHVVHHGPLPEPKLAAQYSACDIFIAPSTGQESFGLVLLEAMSAARPLICSDIEGYRQAANPAGTVWCPPREVGALTHAIAFLAGNPDARRRMGENNREFVKRFEWSLLTPRIRSEYLRAIADKHLCPAAKQQKLVRATRLRSIEVAVARESSSALTSGGS